jgi:hypothetical protein
MDMRESDRMQEELERALAFAHAALAEPTPERVALARRCARELMPRMARARRRAMTLGEARELLGRMQNLRAVLAAIDGGASMART